ncbi:MAG: DIP1984 family protein [Selenomonadaceae bacterium]|nr:DIP1984 family protein [Selenomonadaceae bacterium]
MKLAEALQERADLNRKIAQLKDRLRDNALHQEGESPAEDPMELLSEIDSSLLRLEEIISKVNLKNSQTIVEGKSITEWISRRDCLQMKLSAYDRLIESASGMIHRASGREIKILSSVDVRSLRKVRDSIAKEIREVDNLIQRTNWETDL